MELFSITCTTCNARLTVRSMAAIGQILACPKCQSMVQIAAPEGWTPPVANGKPVDTGARTKTRAAANRGKSAGRAATNPAAPADASGSLDSDFATPAATASTATSGSEPSTPETPPAAASTNQTIVRRTVMAAGLAVAICLTLFFTLRPQTNEPASVVVAVDDPPVDASSSEDRSDDKPAATDEHAAQVAAPTPSEPTEPPTQAPDEPKADSEPGAIPPLATPSSPTAPMPLPQRGAAMPPVSIAAAPSTPANQAAESAEPLANSKPLDEAAELTSEVSAEDRAIATRLEERIAAIDFQRTKLSDLAEFLARMANVTLRFDPEALVAANVKTTAPVSVKQTETTVGRALDAALEKLGLAYEIRDAQVVIVTRPDPPARPKQPAKSTTAGDQAADAAAPKAKADLRLDAPPP
jgi:hypothetical protein